jgi:transposase
MVDHQGVPLAIGHTAANVHDSQMLGTMIAAIPAVLRPRGRPRKRPHTLHADKGYGYPRCHRVLQQRHITSRIARQGIDSGGRLGRYRWVVERTLSWLNRYRRLEVRDERREATHQAFLTQGCALIGWHFIERFC